MSMKVKSISLYSFSSYIKSESFRLPQPLYRAFDISQNLCNKNQKNESLGKRSLDISQSNRTYKTTFKKKKMKCV